MKHLVYLAGPISGCSFTSCTHWREEVAAALDSDIIKTLSPMRAKEFLESKTSMSKIGYEGHPLTSQQGVITRDRFDAMRCDVLFVNLLHTTAVSIGSILEIAYADSQRTPIVCVMEPGNIHEHAMILPIIGFRCDTLQEGIDTVKAIME